MTSLLATSLACAVPLRIAQLEACGGPSDGDFQRAREFGQTLAEKGDVLQFGGKPGEAARLFNGLADAVAVAAFCPGGARVFGDHYVGRGAADVSGAEMRQGAISGLTAFLESLRALQ